MRLSPTLLAYLGRQFLTGIIFALAILLALVLIIDIVELLRRAEGRATAGILEIFEMAALRLPFMAQKVLPFATLFGGMYTFLHLSRSQELIVTRSAGVSVWQFLMPALFIAFVVGTLAITLFNPIASIMMSRYELLDNKHLRGRPSLLAVSSTGLWLRQADAQGQSVIHAGSVSRQGAELERVIVFLYDGADRFESRIDAARARLTQGYWELENALLTPVEGKAEAVSVYRLPTTMTSVQIQESFTSPATMSFWALPAFIEMLEQAGFAARKHLLHWHALLATPLLLCAMVLIAATFSLRLTQRGGLGLLAIGGVLAGFLLFFLTDLVLALGESGAIPAVLAAWTPAGVSSLLGLAMLFHLEDG
ncbi:MAG: LPS export ABC transporter permease LptG [Proteobacteria bacterium]|nr:LPS export ABC transporter permease LptG [Pseudomonadota bacterium]